MTIDQRSTSTLYLPRTLVNKLLAHAQKNPDIEVCGLIANDTSNHKDYYPVENISEHPDSRFLMDASQQIKAMKQMREQQQELFAIVHSHPTTNATPSPPDIQENDYKNVFYIIISLNTKGVLEMRAYTQQDDNMQVVDLILEDED
jgi:proteasome lid subunit RPN8/RPN11